MIDQTQPAQPGPVTYGRDTPTITTQPPQAPGYGRSPTMDAERRHMARGSLNSRAGLTKKPRPGFRGPSGRVVF